MQERMNAGNACREVKVTESSESVLAGTKRPPFRLVVRVVMATDGRRAPIRPAVSEEFVVRSWIHRSRWSCKQLTPHKKRHL